MSPLKYTLFLALLSLPAFAGPSDGTGTNLVIEENQLADFSKFRAEFGDKQILINPRKFKMPKEAAPVYDDVKPLMERAETLYPGLGVMMEKVFDKPWLIVNAEFAGRNAGEKKVISQTDAAVYVSMPWLKKASPKQIREAFLHEGARRFAHDLVEMLTYNKKAQVDHAALDDEITESLTPVLFNRLPLPILKERMDGATIAIRNFSIDKDIVSDNGKRHPRLATREEMYADLKAVDGANAIRKICDSATNGGFFANMNSINKTWEILKALTPEQRDLLKKYRQEFAREPVLSLDPSAEAAMSLLTDPLPRSSSGFVDPVKVCPKNKHEHFLSEYEKSAGKVHSGDEEVTELPDEESKEVPAK